MSTTTPMRLVGAQNRTLLNLLQPTLAMVTVGTITAGLARSARYNGQAFWGLCPSLADYGWTVGEHTLLVYQIAKLLGYNAAECQAVLMHDFHEAYTSDIPSPMIKALADLAGADFVHQIQERIQAVIELAFGYTRPNQANLNERILVCDYGASLLEMEYFWPHSMTPITIAVCDRLRPARHFDFDLMANRHDHNVVANLLHGLVVHEFPHMEGYDERHTATLAAQADQLWEIERARMDRSCQAIFESLLAPSPVG
jgi:hypothetical protein